MAPTTFSNLDVTPIVDAVLKEIDARVAVAVEIAVHKNLESFLKDALGTVDARDILTDLIRDEMDEYVQDYISNISLSLEVH